MARVPKDLMAELNRLAGQTNCKIRDKDGRIEVKDKEGIVLGEFHPRVAQSFLRSRIRGNQVLKMSRSPRSIYGEP